MSKILIIKEHYNLWKFISKRGEYIYSLIDSSGWVTVRYSKERTFNYDDIYHKMDIEKDELIDEFFINDFFGGYVQYNLRNIAEQFRYRFENCEFIEIDPHYYDEEIMELKILITDEDLSIEIEQFIFGTGREIIFTNYIKIFNTKFKYRGISILSGAGLFDRPFHDLLYGTKPNQKTFQIIKAFELNKFACQTYKHHFPGTPIIQKDIKNIKSEEFPKDLDFVIAGLSCKGYSELRYQRNGVVDKKRWEKETLNDSRNLLYKQLIRVLQHSKPKVFIMENVRNITKILNGNYLKLITKEFEEVGYRIKWRNIDAKDQGDPQTRTRFIMKGILNSEEMEHNFPKKSRGYSKNLLPYRTVKDAIWDLRSNPGEYYKRFPTNEWLQKRHWLLPNGFSKDYFMYQRKLNWNKPSTTIKATMWNIPLHPDSNPMIRTLH